MEKLEEIHAVERDIKMLMNKVKGITATG